MYDSLSVESVTRLEGGPLSLDDYEAGLLSLDDDEAGLLSPADDDKAGPLSLDTNESSRARFGGASRKKAVIFFDAISKTHVDAVRACVLAQQVFFFMCIYIYNDTR